ncbi:MAG: hypothetical protein ACKVZH_06660 [Blastocatellia bacterium]
MLQAVTDTDKRLTVYVGSPTQIEALRVASCHVVFVHADGDELEHIRTTFQHLPDCPARKVMTWFGDFAKIIASNF